MTTKRLWGMALLSLCWSTGMSQVDVRDRFVGTWFLQAIEQPGENGEWVESDLLGPNPVGILTYDEHGNMAAQLTRRDRTIPDPENAPAELVNGYVAYFGTYEVDSAAGTVTHHRTAHNNADLGQLTVVRSYRFEGDRLELTVAPGGEFRLTWLRQK